MSSEYTPLDVVRATITVPGDGDDATAANANAGTKDVADNAEVLRASLAHITNADVLTPGSRNKEDGVLRLRSVADLTALAALVVGAGDDQALCLVEGTDGNIVYFYDHGNADPEFSPFVMTAHSSTGVWRVLNFSLLDSKPGLPYVDAAGRLGNVTTSPGMTVFTEAWQENGTDATETQLYTATDNTTYTEASALKTTAAVKTGDVVDVSVTFLVSCLGTGANRATARGIVGLAVESSSGTLAAADIKSTSLVADVGAASEVFYPMTLHARYVAESDGTVDIRLFAKTNTITAGSATIRVLSPLQGSVKVTRP